MVNKYWSTILLQPTFLASFVPIFILESFVRKLVMRVLVANLWKFLLVLNFGF